MRLDEILNDNPVVRNKSAELAERISNPLDEMALAAAANVEVVDPEKAKKIYLAAKNFSKGSKDPFQLPDKSADELEKVMKKMQSLDAIEVFKKVAYNLDHVAADGMWDVYLSVTDAREVRKLAKVLYQDHGEDPFDTNSYYHMGLTHDYDEVLDEIKYAKKYQDKTEKEQEREKEEYKQKMKKMGVTTYVVPTFEPKTLLRKAQLKTASFLYAFTGYVETTSASHFFKIYKKLYEALKGDTVGYKEWEVSVQTRISPEKLKEIYQILDQTSDIMKKKGYSFLLGGDVVIMKSGATTYAGQYQASSDIIKFNAKHTDSNSVGTMVHELGHRYWYKKLSENQRKRYVERLSEGETIVGVNYDSVKEWADLISYVFQKLYEYPKKGYKYKPTLIAEYLSYGAFLKNNALKFRVKAFQPKQWIEIFDAWLEEKAVVMNKIFAKYKLMKLPQNGKFDKRHTRNWAEIMMNWSEKEFKRFYNDLYKLLYDGQNYIYKKAGQAVTHYASTKVEEDFAETFEEYILTGRVQEEAPWNRFKEVMGL